MSKCIYTECDVCHKVCPEPPGSEELLEMGWSMLQTVGADYDLCPDCSTKLMNGKAIGKVGTCAVESIQTSAYGPDFKEFKLTCGDIFDYKVGEKPSYCPVCGARVVRRPGDGA